MQLRKVSRVPHASVFLWLSSEVKLTGKEVWHQGTSTQVLEYSNTPSQYTCTFSCIAILNHYYGSYTREREYSELENYRATRVRT
jgi:hypothetical protein